MTRSDGKRILVAGIGNVFHGDDAFGVEVARALGLRNLPEAVQVTDFGIRSYDLAFAMLDGYEAVVLVDAVYRGKPAGTLFLLEIDSTDLPERVPSLGHGMNPQVVLTLVNAMGGYDGRIYLVGCEPERLDMVDGDAGLSASVAGCVQEAAMVVERLVAQLLAEGGAQANVNEPTRHGG